MSLQKLPPTSALDSLLPFNFVLINYFQAPSAISKKERKRLLAEEKKKEEERAKKAASQAEATAAGMAADSALGRAVSCQ